MQNQLEILHTDKYEIDVFQREYMWQRKQMVELIDDRERGICSLNTMKLLILVFVTRGRDKPREVTTLCKVFLKYPTSLNCNVHLEYVTMETKILLIAAIVIAATATLGLAPALTSISMAEKPASEICVHNGNGDNKCTGGASATHCERVHGKYVCTRD
jgi:hypothetical protein